MRIEYAVRITIAAITMSLGLTACTLPSTGSANIATPVPIPTALAPTVANPEPTAVMLEPTAIAEPTSVEPTAVVEPTAIAEPTAVVEPPSTPAAPTPTLQPLEANTIPEDGEFDDELPFNTTANDPGIGGNSGDGIQNVTFQFFGPDGREVYSHTENSTLYCAFGGGDDGQNCSRWIFSEHQNQWPNGKPAQSGPHKLVVTIRGVTGATARNERQITLNLLTEPTPTLLPLEANTFPAGDIFGDELAFETFANDPSAGADDGAGIASVTFRIIDSQGNNVYERTENNPRYCAFGGGDNGQDCNVWRFSEHNQTWPGGASVVNGGVYRLEAIIKATNGQQLTQELTFTIQLP